MNIIARWCNRIYPMFQSYADQIKAWHLSSEIDTLLDDVWEILPNVIQKSIFKFVSDVYKKYGEELARTLLERIMKAIKDKLT